MAVKIYKDSAAGVVFFEGSTINPVPCNVGLAYAKVDESDRIVVERTDKKKRNGSNRTLWKRLKFTRVQDRNGNQISASDRQAVLDYLNGVLQEAEPTDVAASYKGGWNATSNIPDILSGSATNGDWYFVGVSGSFDAGSGSIDFLVNDVVKFVSRSNGTSEWERIPNETVRVDQLDTELDNIVRGSALTQYNIYVDANYTGSQELGSSLRPYTDIQTAVNAAPSTGHTEILVNGEFNITTPITITGNKDVHFNGTEGSKVKYASYNQANGGIFTYTGTNYSGHILIRNLTLQNAGAFAINTVSASKVEVVDCVFTNNGWSGTGISLTETEAGSTLGYNSTTSSLATFYSNECSEGGAMYIANCATVELTDNVVNNNNKGFEILDSGYVGNTNASGFVARNQVYNNISIGLELESSTGTATAGCKNFTVYNNSFINHGDSGVKIEGGLNNTVSLSIFKGNWNSAIQLEHVSNARVRDLDLDNNNRAGVDAEGDQATGLASIQVSGHTINSEATFICDIFNVAILNTQLGSSAVKVGILLKDTLEDHTDDAAIIKLDNLTFMNQDFALDMECNLESLKVLVGECEYINNGAQPVRVQGTGNYSELPYKNLTVDIPYLNVTYDNVSKEVTLKEQVSGQVINTYPVNTLQAVIRGTHIDILQRDSRKIQLRGLTEDRIQLRGLWLSGSIDDVNNALNAIFTETLPSVYTPTPTITVDSGSVTTYTTSSYILSSSGNISGSQFGFNAGAVFVEEAINDAGEYYDFNIKDPGTIIMGLNLSGSTGTGASSSLGTGTGSGEDGMYWGVAFRQSTQGPWKAFGTNSANTSYLSGWYNFDDSDTGADWISGEDITMRAGLNNDGIPFLAYSSSAAGGFVNIARNGTPFNSGSDNFNLVIKFVENTKLISTPVIYQDPSSLVYYAIESPDGQWHYPLFQTAEEANYFDEYLANPAGTGISHTHVYVDDLSGTTWYMPDNGGEMHSTTHPTASTITGVTWNFIATADDNLYAPSGFGTVTTTLNEGDTLNYEIVPSGYPDTRTLVNPPSWISLPGNNAVGTAPQVFLANTVVPSASYDITVRSSNAYGTTDGTLTVKVLNTTTNASLDGTIHQGTFLSVADYNSDYNAGVSATNIDAVVRTSPAGENGAVYDLPNTLDDGDSLEWPFTRFLNIGIVSESVDKTGDAIVFDTDFNTRFDLLFSTKGTSTHEFSRPSNNDLAAIGWDDNSNRTIPGGPHSDTSNDTTPSDTWKLYNNAGRIELSYDINDGNGYQLFASSSALHGTGSDAPTLTVVLPEGYTVGGVILPTFTYTANGASAPNGFSLVNGAMDTSLITVSESVASLDSIQINPGQRLVVDKEWAETNVLPYISEVADSNVLLGISASGASWTEVGNLDFDIATRWSNEGINATRHRLYVTGSSTGTNNVNSDTNGFYDHAIEFTREGNLFIGRTAESNNNVETLLYNSNTWANSGIINAWTASRGNENPITPILGGDDSRMRLSTTGLNVQRAPLPTRHYDVVEDTFGLPVFKRYNETDLAIGELSLDAGYVHKFWLHDSSIESTDALSFVSASDSTAITQGITSSGTPGTFGAYLEFNVPSDVRPIKTGWTSGGTLTTGSLSIVGSTYVEGVTGITLEGPAANQNGTVIVPVNGYGKHGWLSLDETLAAGQRLVLSNAFFIDLLAYANSNSGYADYEFAIGLKGDNWANTQKTTGSNTAAFGIFKGNAYLSIRVQSSYNVRIKAYANGNASNEMLLNTQGLHGDACAFIDITSSGDNIRLGFGRNGNAGVTAGDESTTTYANWSSYKVQTGAQSYGISTLDVLFLAYNSFGATAEFDTAEVDWTELTEIAVPTTPTILTDWDKAVDFSGGNEHLKQVSTANNTNPLRMANLSVTVPANSDNSRTSDDTNSRPWATAIVFKYDGNSSNQHIWNSGEGAGNTDDNIYLRLDASGYLYFGWGRQGALNECRFIYLGTGVNTTHWHGIYIAHNGTRLSGNNATAANLAAAFDIRWMTTNDNPAFTNDYGNRSTAANWTAGSTGGRMDRSVTGDFTIGGRGSNRNFHGKVASMVITTLRVDVTMPTDAEIKLMLTDPKKWEDDYRDGNFVRASSTTSYSGYTPSNVNTGHGGTQIWLMGDGVSDSYSNGIRNEVYPSDQNNTKLQFNSMASNDIETVTISGLS